MQWHDLTAFALESAISTQLILFAAFLLSSPKRASALYLLAGLSGVLASMITANLLIAAAGWPQLANLVLFLDLLAPALFYLYVRQVRHPAEPLRPLQFGHALPAIVGVTMWKAGALSSMDPYAIAFWTAYVIAAGYLFARNPASYAPSMLRQIIVMLLAVFATTIVLRVVMAFQAAPQGSFLDGTAYLAVLAAMFLATCQLLFISLRYPRLLTDPACYVKYAQSSVGAKDRQAFDQKLASLLQGRKLYLDPDITLAELSAMLGASPRQVSQLVNARFGMNISAYLNQCRIQEAARLLADAPEQPIKVVMFASGFKSKSAFNREFQRCLGVSPTAFRRNKATALQSQNAANKP